MSDDDLVAASEDWFARTPTDLSPSGRTLLRSDTAADPRGLILMLHGGTAASHDVVDGRSASWKRSTAMQRAISERAHAVGVSTWMLRYSQRGWNGGAPVADARWALAHAKRELGEVPIVLLGHSMGARTSAYVADDPQVVGVVALAPWWSAEDPVRSLRGKHVRAAHGRSDKITLYRMTRAYLNRAEPVAASTELTSMGRVGHYMLRRIRAWNDFAIENSLDLLEAPRPA